VGKLETYGVELDATAMVVENLRLSLGAAYTHGK